MRNGIKFRNFHNWYRVRYAFSENWYKVGYIFLKIGIKSGIRFGKIGIRNGYVFEALMARTRPKSGQEPPPPPEDRIRDKASILSNVSWLFRDCVSLVSVSCLVSLCKFPSVADMT